MTRTFGVWYECFHMPLHLPNKLYVKSNFQLARETDSLYLLPLAEYHRDHVSTSCALRTNSQQTITGSQFSNIDSKLSTHLVQIGLFLTRGKLPRKEPEDTPFCAFPRRIRETADRKPELCEELS